jgi:hypothetical protein
MRNVAPSRVITRRSNQLVTLAFLVGAIGAFLAAIGVLMIIVPLDRPDYPSYDSYVFVRGAFVGIGAIVIMIAVAMAIRALTYRKDNDLALLTGRVLEPMLDERFTFIRNINRRDIGYVDAALVGPPGVLVLRIVGETGAFANEGVNWLRQNSAGQWLPAGFSPTLEDIADVRKVREALAKANLAEVPVYGLIVFTQDPSRVGLTLNNPQVPVTHLVTLMPTLSASYLALPPLDMSVVNAVVTALYE